MEHSPPLLEGGGGGGGEGSGEGGPPPSGRTTIALGLLGRPQLRMAPQGPSEIAKNVGCNRQNAHGENQCSKPYKTNRK